VNFLCHRDYKNPKFNGVAIFKDCIEIYNSGTFQKYINGCEISILRNPLILKILYFCKKIKEMEIEFLIIFYQNNVKQIAQWDENKSKIISIISQNNKTGLSEIGVEKITKRVKYNNLFRGIGGSKGGCLEVNTK